jgi:uncharacterized protein
MTACLFVDTSALIALLNADDRFHAPARAAWTQWLADDAALWTSNYVLVETSALVQHRIGVDGLRVLYDTLLPVVRVAWVDEETHDLALAALFAAGRRQLSLVDCTSFQVMRRLSIGHAFTFDPHFQHHGIEVLPDLA